MQVQVQVSVPVSGLGLGLLALEPLALVAPVTVRWVKEVQK